MLWSGFLLAWLLAALFMFIVGVQRNLGAHTSVYCCYMYVYNPW